MCSLGKHQEGDDIRPARRRRRLDGSITEAVAKAPRATVAEQYAKKHAELTRDVQGEPEPLEPDQFQMNFEPLPPGIDQLPAHLVDEEAVGEPRNWWSGMS